jgi:hypothetical protein
MKKLLLATVCALVSWSASAADLPTKAQPIPYTLNLANGGFYFGIWSEAGMESVTPSGPITGANPNSITSVDAGIGGLVGYLWNLPNNCATCFVAVEAWAGWSNVNGNAAGFSYSGPAMLKQRILYGADTATIAAAFPQLFPFTPPPFPGNLGNITNIKPYVYAAVDELDVSLNVPGLGSNRLWSISPEFGLGAKGQVSASVAVDVFAGVRLPQKGVCVGVAAALGCAGMGTAAVTGVSLDF